MREEMIAEMALIKAQISELDERYSELSQEAGLDKLDPGLYPVGRVLVEVQENRRFDSKRAGVLFSKERFPDLYEEVVNPTKAKKLLTSSQYREAQTRFPNNKITIKVM